MSEYTITRRDFLKGTTAAALALTLGVPLNISGEQKNKTKVVLIRNPDVLNRKGKINEPIVRKMLDDAVSTLLNKNDPVEAWKTIVKPDDIVGVKSNVWTHLPTPLEIEDAIRMRLMNVGVVEKKISFDDRGVLGNRVFRQATVLINVRPLRTHHWSGIGGCIKNYVMFAPNPADYHSDSCADLGALWNLPIVKDKTRLNILVMLTPQFHNIGPHHFSKEFTWQYKGILVGTDPVALDAVGLRILEAKRRDYFGEETPLKPPAKHIALADTKHKIGTSKLKEIEIVKLGWKEELYIE